MKVTLICGHTTRPMKSRNAKRLSGLSLPCPTCGTHQLPNDKTRRTKP